MGLMGKWLRLGGLELLVVSDGQLKLDAGGLFGITPRAVWEPLVEPLDDRHRLPLGLNCLIIRAQGKTILAETGCGTKPTRIPGLEGTGRLLDELSAEGIRREDIDIVVNTHLHFDHAGGNTILEDGKPAPTFPRARYLIQQAEWEAAQRPNERSRAIYLPENLEPPSDAGQVEIVDGEVEIAERVRLIPAPGHTIGTARIEVESEGDLLFHLGDVAHPLILERIAWIAAFDVQPMVSLETKRLLLERALDKQALLSSVHFAYPGLGRLHIVDEKRRWEPL